MNMRDTTGFITAPQMCPRVSMMANTAKPLASATQSTGTGSSVSDMWNPTEVAVKIRMVQHITCIHIFKHIINGIVNSVVFCTKPLYIQS